MNPTGHRSLPRRLLKWTALMVALLGLLTAAAALTAWINRGWIANRALDIAEARLAERGLYIRRGSYGFSLQRGVILNQLVLFTDKEKQNQLASFDNIGIRIPWLEFTQTDPRLILSAKDSGLTLNSTAGEFRLNQVNLSMTCTHSSLAIDQLDARLRNLRVTAGGQLHWQPDGTPTTFTLPDLSTLVKASSWLDFPRGTPSLALEINSSPRAGVALKGHLTGSGFGWRNMSFARADVRAVLADGAVEIPSLDVDCYGGNLKAALTVEYTNGLLKVAKLTSSVEPFRFVEAVMGSTSLKSCRTLGTTTLSGNNLVFNNRDFYRSTGVLKADSPAGLAIALGRPKIVMKDFHGSVKFDNGKLAVNAERFAILGGSATGTYTTPLRGNYTYQLAVKGDGLLVKDIAQQYSKGEDVAGHLNMTFNGGGANGMESHFGNGHIQVSDGEFYSIPLFGSLRSMLTQQSAKFGVDEARDLTCTYSLRDGVVRSKDLRIESTATKLLANGQVDLIQLTLNADVRANLRGVVGLATVVPSLIFELHGEGPLNDVHWKMAHVPGIIQGAAEVTVEGVKTVTEGAGKVIEGIGGTASKILGGRPGFLLPKPQPKPKK